MKTNVMVRLIHRKKDPPDCFGVQCINGNGKFLVFTKSNGENTVRAQSSVTEKTNGHNMSTQSNVLIIVYAPVSFRTHDRQLWIEIYWRGHHVSCRKRIYRRTWSVIRRSISDYWNMKYLPYKGLSKSQKGAPVGMASTLAPSNHKIKSDVMKLCAFDSIMNMNES